MPKKTTVLIAILAIVTVVLLFLAITQGQKQTTSQTTQVTPTQHVVQKTTKLFFNPANLDLSAGTATTSPSVDIYVDTGNGSIAGVQAELQYDPKAITNVKLLPASDVQSFFGATPVVLFNDINPTTGRISYAIAIGAGQPAKKGVGKIATLVFQKAFGATTSATTIKFLDKTLVTQLGESQSVLKATAPLNITLSSTTTTAPIQYVPQTTSSPVVPTTQY